MGSSNSTSDLQRMTVPNLEGLPKAMQQGLDSLNKCICHVVYAESENTNLLLQEVEYDIKIVENISEITINQTYENPLMKPADIEYLFTIDPEAVFASLVVTIGEKNLVGVVKGKEEARNEFDEKVKKGQTVVYSEQDDVNQDIIRVKLGNLMPGDRLQISLTYYEQLQVCVNKFWRLSIPTSFRPRYKGQNSNAKAIPNRIQKFFRQQYTLSEIKFNLSIKTTKPLTFLKSPSHDLIEEERNDNYVKFKQFTTLTGKDIQLLYSTAGINEPTSVVSQIRGDENAHQRTCVTVNFIPQFNPIPTDDAYQSYVQDNLASSDQFDFDNSNQKGFFIFLIDRSGSMGGTNIQKAKEALILFLRSLPVDSYFQIVSFGSDYQFLWQNAQKFNQDTMNYAIQMVYSFDADLGGTEILQPLQAIHRLPDIEGYPTNIFILTDGEVSNTEQVADLSNKMKSPTRRIYTLGIGNGCSRYLVEKVAIMGNGKYVFVADNENLNEKVIDLLQDSITPFLKDLKVQIDNPKGLVALIPDPSSITCVRKSETVTFFALFNSEAEKEIKFKISCWDSVSKSTKGYECVVLSDNSIETKTFHKLAAHRLIQSVENAYKYSITTSDVLYAKKHISQQDIANIAIQNQILCSQTAFICVVGTQAEGDALQQILKEKIQVKVKNSNNSNFMSYLSAVPMQSQPGMQPQPPMPLPPGMAAHRSMAIPCSAMMSMPAPPSMSIAMQSQMPPPPPPPKAHIPQSMAPQMYQAPQIQSLSQYDYSDMEENECCDSMEQDMMMLDAQCEMRASSPKIEMKSIQSDYKLVLNFQDFNGKFIFNSGLLQIIGINEQQFKQSQPNGMDLDIWTTIVIMDWLETYCQQDQKSWMLIFKKARDYLSQNSIKYQEFKANTKSVLNN